jgi:cytidylate kinase
MNPLGKVGTGGIMEHTQPDITARISERQMRLWNALHSGERTKTSRYRFLTISRDEGTLGNDIARALAHELGWHLYDKEIVNYIAQNNHVREDMVRQLDEKSQSLIHETILHLLQMPETSPFGTEEYHESLLKTLATIATQGQAILMGRGANFALGWLEQGLHVRITGSLEVRIERICKDWQLKPEQARRRLSGIDAERRTFIRHHFRRDFDDLHWYDLVFNTDRLSGDQVVSSIMSLMELNAPLLQPSVS